MSVKTIEHPDGRKFRFGRKQPVARCPRMKMHYYMSPALPQPPTQIGYSAAAATSLSKIYDNDNLGDCVIACIAHAEGVFTGNAGAGPLLFTDAQIIDLYGAIGGYVPGDPSTDNGCDEVTAWNYWQQKGAMPGEQDPHKIIGFLELDGTNSLQTSTAIWLFENLLFGVALPDDWVNPVPSGSGFTWDVAGDPDPANGHCFLAMGYAPGVKYISTWGMQGAITDAAIARYAVPSVGGAVYTALSQDIISKAQQKAPNGFSWGQLQIDFERLS